MVDEDQFLKWIEVQCLQGTPPMRQEIVDEAAARLRNKNGEAIAGTLEKWWPLFLQRHPEVSKRLAQHAETQRLEKTPTKSP